MMKFFLTAILFALSILYSQEPITEKRAHKTKSPNSKEIFYVIKGTDTKHGEYSKTLRGIISISEKGQYENGVKMGLWEYYDSNGEVEQRYDFTENKLIYNKYAGKAGLGITKSAVIIDGKLYENNTGELPVFLGGMSKYSYYLANNLRYPSREKSGKIEGTVIISVTITIDGKIVDEQIEGEAGYGLGEEALRVVKLLPDEWIALSIEDKPVATRSFIPIRFQSGPP